MLFIKQNVVIFFSFVFFLFIWPSMMMAHHHKHSHYCCQKRCNKPKCEKENKTSTLPSPPIITSPSPIEDRICFVECYDGLIQKYALDVGISYTSPYNTAICNCGLSDYVYPRGPFRDCRCYMGSKYAQCAFAQSPKVYQSVLLRGLQGCPPGPAPLPEPIPSEPPLPKKMLYYRCDWPGIGSANNSPETATGCHCMGSDTSFNATLWPCHCYVQHETYCSFDSKPKNFIKLYNDFKTTTATKRNFTMTIPQITPFHIEPICQIQCWDEVSRKYISEVPFGFKDEYITAICDCKTANYTHDCRCFKDKAGPKCYFPEESNQLLSVGSEC